MLTLDMGKRALTTRSIMLIHAWPVSCWADWQVDLLVTVAQDSWFPTSGEKMSGVVHTPGDQAIVASVSFAASSGQFFRDSGRSELPNESWLCFWFFPKWPLCVRRPKERVWQTDWCISPLPLRCADWSFCHTHCFIGICLLVQR